MTGRAKTKRATRTGETTKPKILEWIDKLENCLGVDFQKRGLGFTTCYDMILWLSPFMQI